MGHASLNVNVGSLIRRERQHQGLSLRELARRVGVSASMLSQVETGRTRPSVSTIYAIATELGLSIDALLSDREAAVATATETRSVGPTEMLPGKVRSISAFTAPMSRLPPESWSPKNTAPSEQHCANFRVRAGVRRTYVG